MIKSKHKNVESKNEMSFLVIVSLFFTINIAFTVSQAIVFTTSFYHHMIVNFISIHGVILLFYYDTHIMEVNK